MRLYESEDVIGAQVGGAIKNILAIAAGILDGLNLGNNARAAMLTRGLVEMGRYARALGGDEKTIWGLSGMGDLLLTATSTLSRNYRFGQLVGRGVPTPEAKLRIGTVEGIIAARIVTVQAQAHGLDLAIVSAVDGILHGDVTPLRAIEYLMERPRTMEFAA
jgi:glycerol-3-phosphate dehydrogenase (NAD(P)+)